MLRLQVMLEPTHRIVVALDLSEYAEIVLEHALSQAIFHEAPDLHFITVVEHSKLDLDDVKHHLAALVIPALEGIDRKNWRVHLHVRQGKAAEEIANLAADIRAHLLVVGRFGVHHPHRRIGKSANEIIGLATCPVYVVVLSDQSPDVQPQCPDCVAIRASSKGEIWFCAKHVAADGVNLDIAIDSSVSFTDGGLMW